MTAEIDQLFDEANGNLAIGELEEAALKYRQCIELAPDFFEGWQALGMALMKTGKYPEAIEAGLKCVELRPNDQLAWSSLSLFYVRNGNIKEAEAAGGKARILSWGESSGRNEGAAASPGGPAAGGGANPLAAAGPRSGPHPTVEMYLAGRYL